MVLHSATSLYHANLYLTPGVRWIGGVCEKKVSDVSRELDDLLRSILLSGLLYAKHWTRCTVVLVSARHQALIHVNVPQASKHVGCDPHRGTLSQS